MPVECVLTINVKSMQYYAFFSKYFFRLVSVSCSFSNNAVGSMKYFRAMGTWIESAYASIAPLTSKTVTLQYHTNIESQ